MNRFKIRNKTDAVRFLAKLAADRFAPSRQEAIILATDFGNDAEMLASLLESHGIRVSKQTIGELEEISHEEVRQHNAVIAGFFDPKSIHELTKVLMNNKSLNGLPFECIVLAEGFHNTIAKHDIYEGVQFISPLSLSKTDYLSLYESSLAHFKKKCQIRDFLDMSQLLTDTVNRGVEGDVAEFGSLDGHSSYLIASLLKYLQSEKHLYLFDLFGETAIEPLGIDQFWNAIWNESSRSNYADVKEKMSVFKNAKLIKGDFTKSFEQAAVNKLCFVFIDCDSYRGTKFILDTVYDNHLSKRGVIAFEDYGHPPLIGSRLAFHEFFDDRCDCIRFFSHYSGVQFVIKE